MITSIEAALADGVNPGNYVRDRCHELGVSVAEFCRKAGITDKSVYNWCGGKCYPSWKALQKLQRAFASFEAQPSHGGALD